jgi:hypothetical protein
MFSFSQDAVNAFATFNCFGGNVHKNISSAALAPLGISEDSFQAIDDGNVSQDYVRTRNFLTASHHFDDNRLADGVNYIDSQLAEAISSAADADKDKKAWKKTLYTFGEWIHAAQDFYAHSNYVEFNLKDDTSLKPEDIPLPDWSAIANISPSRIGLKSGYFFYVNVGNNEITNSRHVSVNMIKLEFKGTFFLSDKEYEEATKDFNGYIKYVTEVPIDVLHRDLNKDNDASSAGKMVNTATGKTIFDYAFNLAVRETSREWIRLEDGIREEYPAKADRIILSLKKGIGKIKVARGPLARPAITMAGLE